jgi:uncharacterized repeat protein (TIGR03803 family)
MHTALRAFVGIVLVGVLSTPSHGDVSVLHEFKGGTGDGILPYAGLTASGSTLYGVTNAGGAINKGTVWKIESNGTGYGILHSFLGPSQTDGASPNVGQGLTISGDEIYGMTASAIFKLKTDGTNYTQIWKPGSPGYFGGVPMAPVTVAGDTIYATTISGGNGRGTVFKINTDGTTYSLIYAFAQSNDGNQPLGKLLLDGNVLYGTTLAGGGLNGAGGGTIFKVNTDGTGYQLLHIFTGIDGDSPRAGLLMVNGIIYGTTSSDGGPSGRGYGTLFRINPDGSNFTSVHAFDAFAGGDPATSLIFDGNLFYGTGGGGDLQHGVVFRIRPDGGDFEVLYSFGRTDAFGMPEGDISLVGDTLYGTTPDGEATNRGAVYALVVPEPSTLILAALGLVIVWCMKKPAT